MTSEEFARKWRKVMGCESCKSPEAPRVCWCDVCCNLERIWDEVRQQVVEEMRQSLKKIEDKVSDA